MSCFNSKIKSWRTICWLIVCARKLERVTWIGVVSFTAKASGANRTQAGSLCYIYVVASSPRVHDKSSRDPSERTLDCPETNVA
jgi:hypothetical protein